MSPGKGIMAHREPNGVLHAYVGLKKPHDWSRAIKFTDRAAVAVHVSQAFDGWAQELTALITDCEVITVARAIYTLPWSRDGHGYRA